MLQIAEIAHRTSDVVKKRSAFERVLNAFISLKSIEVGQLTRIKEIDTTFLTHWGK